MIKKKLLSFVFVLLIIASLCFTACAGFTSDLPNYVDYSGGAWFEVYDSAVGRCTVIFPIEFKDNIFGFKLSNNGIPTDIINFSNSTVYGLVITSNGTEYACRASRFSSIEYQTSSSSYNQYVALSPDAISLSNSNMLFLTDDVNYINDTVPDYEKYQNIMFLIIAFSSFFALCVSLLRRGRRYD